MSASDTFAIPPQAAHALPRRNRAFVYISVAMAGLVLLGILALVAALTLWLPAQRERQVAAVTSTVSAMTRVAAQWTVTPASTSTPVPPTATPTQAPTQTPQPTATSTRVVTQEQLEASQAAKTPTPVPLPGTTPAAGMGVGGIAATAAGLVVLLFFVRILRGQG